MKKLTVLLAALLMAGASATANNNLPFISFGAKVGVNVNKQKIDFSNISSNIDDIKNNAAGFNAGIVARLDFPVLPLYVQGELLYDFGKAKIPTLGSILGNKNETPSVVTHNFSVPVLLGAGIGSSSFVKLRANLGPVFNLVSTAKLSDIATTDDRKSMFTRQTVTWTAGIGVDIFKIMVDIRYNGAFSKKDITLSDVAGGLKTGAKSSPSSWTFSVGYLF